MECLSKIGTLFEAMSVPFEDVAFPSSSPSRRWTARPVDVGLQVSPTTGKGYLNTFQDDKLFEPAMRQAAFAKRLESFLVNGGSLSEIIELTPNQEDSIKFILPVEQSLKGKGAGSSPVVPPARSQGKGDGNSSSRSNG